MPSKAKGLHHPGRLCRNSMPGRRPRHLATEHTGKAGELRYGVSGPGHLATEQARKAAGLRLWSGRAGYLAEEQANRRPTPDATRLPFQAFRALCVSALVPSLPRPGRKELAEFQFSLEAMGLQREADAELPSAPLEAVGVGRGIGGIEFQVILPLFDQSP